MGIETVFKWQPTIMHWTELVDGLGWMINWTH